jgi:hypothetical protein
VYFNSASSTIGGGFNNAIYQNVSSATLGGGYQNAIYPGADSSTVGGGTNNEAGEICATVAGGGNNSAWGAQSVVGGGQFNQANATSSTVAGGYQNSALGTDSTVSGGYLNQASGYRSVIAGGVLNLATNDYAVVAGGEGNVAGGIFSFAAGNNALATHNGAFVWADAQGPVFNSTVVNEVSFRAQKGVRIQANKGIHLNGADYPIIVRDWDVFAANAPSSKAGIGRWGLFMEPFHLTIGIAGNDVSGRFFQVAKYSTNGIATQLMLVDQAGNLTTAGTVNGSSDRNAKEGFRSIDPQEVLARVTSMPISEWSYKADAGTRHIGPMAQDFHAAFNVGSDDKHITMLDADGVALAAIQGLNEKLDAENRSLRSDLRARNTRIQSLEERLAALEKIATAHQAGH